MSSYPPPPGAPRDEAVIRLWRETDPALVTTPTWVLKLGRLELYAWREERADWIHKELTVRLWRFGHHWENRR